MVYYFGGKFNPFTDGHLFVLKECIKDTLCTVDQANPFEDIPKFVIGVKDGDFPGSEGHNLCSSSEYRIAMIARAITELITDSEICKFKKAIPWVKDLLSHIHICVQTKPRTWEYFKSSPAWFPEDGKVTLVLGEDEYEDLCSSADGISNTWHHAKEIMSAYPVMHYYRQDTVSSTKVREIMRSNPYADFYQLSGYISRPVFSYIKEYGLYWQFGYEDEYRRKESEFLKHYNMADYPRPSATVDMLILRDNPKDPDMSDVLLIRRLGIPYKNFWALPGGFLDIDSDESLESAASRELEEETGIGYKFRSSDQFRTYSDIGTDPRGRVVDTVFVNDLKDDPTFVKAGDDASDFGWFRIDALPRLAFNHRTIIEDFVHER